MGVCVDFILDHKLSDVSMAAVMRQFSALDSLFLEMARFWSHQNPPWTQPAYYVDRLEDISADTTEAV
jgi:hypothetical protein